MGQAPATADRPVAATSAAAKPRERPERRPNGLRVRRLGEHLDRRLEGKRWNFKGNEVSLGCSHRLARTGDMTATRRDEATKRRSDEIMSVQRLHRSTRN